MSYFHKSEPFLAKLREQPEKLLLARMATNVKIGVCRHCYALFFSCELGDQMAALDHVATTGHWPVVWYTFKQLEIPIQFAMQDAPGSAP